MSRPPALIALTACIAVALVATGCGSGSDSTSTAASGSGTGSQEAAAPTGSKPSKPAEAKAEPTEERAQPSRGTGEEFGKKDPYSAPKGGDNSIQTYGSEASGGEKAAVTGAMFAFFRAMAARNYDRICEAVSAKTRTGIEQFQKLQHKQGDCAAVLESLLGASPGGPQEARKAAEGSVGHVRIGEGNAFVLFTPKNGKPSYFVMTREGGEWKATGFNVGVPLNP